MNIQQGQLTAQGYTALLASRKENNQPVPPPEHFKHAGHHWLAYRPPHSGGGTTAEIIVLQWSPTQLCWYQSGQLATVAGPFLRDGLMTDWVWISHIPVPENI